ncbi:hypothetical protein PI125_g11314 [Phytophthora idaei]|nr:hypothetical protein PI125_g11314 [Phytophthora idaei]
MDAAGMLYQEQRGSGLRAKDWMRKHWAIQPRGIASVGGIVVINVWA